MVFGLLTLKYGSRVGKNIGAVWRIDTPGYGGKQEQEKLDDYEAQDEGGRTSSVQTSYVRVLDQIQH